GFVFGNNVWGWNDEEPSGSSDVFASGEGKTDSLGVLQVAVGKAEAPGNKPWEYTFEAEVQDVSRQTMANRVSWTVHPASVYAGLRQRTTGFAEINKPVPLELVAVDAKGTRVEGVKIDVKVTRREWKYIRKKGVGDRWFTETQEVDNDVSTCNVKTAKTPQECSFTAKDPGFYIIAATATDDQGRKSTTRDSSYVLGPGWVTWQRNDTDRIDLVADKQLYDVGDTAKILVKSPYPDTDAVLTVEREGVLSSKRVHLKGSAESLEVPIDESLIPNAFVSVVLVRGRVDAKDGVETGDDPGRPAVRVGYTQIKVERKSKRLSVKITPDSTEKRPRDKVKVDVAVTDWKNKGTSAEVAVWAVDEGVLRLTNYQVPDPIAEIHPDRGLSVRIGEPLLHLVQRKKYGDKGEGSGGSGGKDSTGADVRRDFRTTVLFTTVVADANGKAHVEFDLPDNLTTFRIMALAVTKEDRFGSGESAVTVSKPLLALPALPRLARVGDNFEAGIVVHSPGAKVKDVQVTAEVKGLTLDGPATDTIAMGDGKPKEVRFKFKAESPGTATLTFRVSGGGEKDAVEQKIPVQLPVSMEAVAVYGDTKDKRTEGLVPPGGVRTDVGGLDVTMASTVMGGFDENMRQLVDYPYGCLEQMSSRLIPFVELRKLHSKFHVAYQGPTNDELKKTNEEDDFIRGWLGGDSLAIYNTRDPDVVIKKTIASIERLQNHDGGFRYWEAEGCSSDYASSYAVLALARAKDVGYPVEAGAISAGQKFLQRVGRGEPNRCYPFPSPPAPAERAFALYTLARTGNPQPSSYGDLFANRKDLPLFAQAMLADAMFIGKGDRTQAKQLMTELMNRAQETPREVHFEEINARSYAAMWSSDTRTTAIILQTLTDVAPDHPYVSKIGNYLTKVRQGTGQFRNTQEAAFSLMALAEVVRTKEKDVPDYTAHVKLGEKELLSASFRGRTTTVQTQKVPMT
ncbi:MAG TPA: alpha-2-macroglobulin family protein, partial [bacterium]|nr:alpha-2-macroglobulin family protein [bacterium]